jgi:hypothetical protein
LTIKDRLIREWAPLGALPVTVTVGILIAVPAIAALVALLFAPDEMTVRGPAFALAGAALSLVAGVAAKRHLEKRNED